MRILPADPVYRHPVKNQKDDTFKYVPGKMLMELFDNFFYIIDGGKCFGGVARLKKTVNDISIQHKDVYHSCTLGPDCLIDYPGFQLDILIVLNDDIYPDTEII